MSWMQKSRSLNRKLENVKHPGRRIEILRACRAGVPGEEGFGKREFLNNVCGDDQKSRKVFKEFMLGARKFKLSSPTVQKAIELLEVPTDMVGIEEPPAPTETPTVEKPRQRTNGKRDHKRINLRVENHLDDTNVNLLVAFNQSTGDMVIRLFEDEPISKEMKKNPGWTYREVWVARVTRKFEGTNQQQKIINEGSASL